ncbi:MAG: hypothetical protein M1538_00625 [Candidatus Marsarchaeota archaeon]|nr:hypothetical protein [Candidatus Marsarchaeota archaeon]
MEKNKNINGTNTSTNMPENSFIITNLTDGINIININDILVANIDELMEQSNAELENKFLNWHVWITLGNDGLDAEGPNYLKIVSDKTLNEEEQKEIILYLNDLYKQIKETTENNGTSPFITVYEKNSNNTKQGIQPN